MSRVISRPAHPSLDVRFVAATVLLALATSACSQGPVSTVAPPPATQAVRASALPPATSAGATPGSPVTPATAVATIAGQGGGALPAGVWGCYNYQPYAGYGSYWGNLRIDGPGAYTHEGVSSGTYALDGPAIAFTSGDLTVYRGEYPVSEGNLDLIGIGEMDGVFVRCGLSGS